MTTASAACRASVVVLALLAVIAAGCEDEPVTGPYCPSADIGLQYREVGNFSEGLAVVQQLDGTYGVIDTTGRLLYTTPYSFFLYSGYIDFGDAFHEGLIRCHSGDSKEHALYGIMDGSGNTVLPPSFEYIGPSKDGIALAMQRNNGKYGYIDATGSWVIQPTIFRTWGFSEGLALVQIDSAHYGFIDRTGALVIPAVYRDGDAFSEGLAPVQSEDGTWDYIDRTGTVVLDLDSAGDCASFSEGFAAVREKHTSYWGFIDRSGRMVIDEIAPIVGSFHDGIAGIGFYGYPIWMAYIDRSGTVLFAFTDGGDFSNGYATVGKACGDHGASVLRGVIDRNGAIVIPLKFDDVGRYGNGCFAVSSGGYAGFIDIQGNLLGPHR